MDAIAERMHLRNERLAEKCSEYGLNVRRNDSLHRPNPWEFLVNKRFHLIWCNVFKAASTSWMYNFNILAGYSPQYLRKTNTVPLELARKRYERVSIQQVMCPGGVGSYTDSHFGFHFSNLQLEKAMNNSVTFLIVRHPFERLLSAYRDKIMFAIPHSLHDKLGNKIIRKYRKNVSWEDPCEWLGQVRLINFFVFVSIGFCSGDFVTQSGHYFPSLWIICSTKWINPHRPSRTCIGCRSHNFARRVKSNSTSLRNSKHSPRINATWSNGPNWRITFRRNGRTPAKGRIRKNWHGNSFHSWPKRNSMDFVIFTSKYPPPSLFIPGPNPNFFFVSLLCSRYDLELFDYSPQPFYDMIAAAQVKTSWELRANGRHTWSSQFQIRQKLNIDLWEWMKLPSMLCLLFSNCERK